MVYVRLFDNNSSEKFFLIHGLPAVPNSFKDLPNNESEKRASYSNIVGVS